MRRKREGRKQAERLYTPSLPFCLFYRASRLFYPPGRKVGSCLFLNPALSARWGWWCAGRKSQSGEGWCVYRCLTIVAGNGTSISFGSSQLITSSVIPRHVAAFIKYQTEAINAGWGACFGAGNNNLYVSSTLLRGRPPSVNHDRHGSAVSHYP